MTMKKIKQGIREPKNAFHYLVSRTSDKFYYSQFKNLKIERKTLEHYQESEKQIESRFKEINGQTRGEKYSPVTISKKDAENLKSIVNHEEPKKVVETGVCNGISSLAILEGVKGSKGHLYSIDLPERPASDEKDFWDGKGGSVIPNDEEPGWIIPEELKENWELVIGNSLYELPDLLERLEAIDMFIHDSEHSYEMMMFEFCLAWKHLGDGGYLICDDHRWNDAFHDFAEAQEREKYRLGNLGMIKK